MSASKLPKTILDLVKPAVDACAMRIYVLTHGRKGKEKAKPNILTFYETGIVFALYEQMLMSPILANWDIRWEERHKIRGNFQWVDLWLRPSNGGLPIRIEAGDVPNGKIGKAHSDADKLIRLHAENQSSSSWFLAFVRDLAEQVKENEVKVTKLYGAAAKSVPVTPHDVLVARIKKSFKRKDGLNSNRLKFDERLVRVFEVYRPGGRCDIFGAILFKVIT